jgi:ribosomal protein L16/L10AE
MKRTTKQYPKHVRYKFPYMYKRLNKNSLNWTQSSNIQNGLYCVKVQEACRLQFYVIKSLFNLLRPLTRDYTEIWFYSRFFLPLTAKPLMRMGTGKGKLRFWVAEYKKGDVIIEIGKLPSKAVSTHIFRSIICKLPMRVKVCKRLFK